MFRVLLLSLTLIAFHHGVLADEESFNPETVLLSHFSLVRPKEWQWRSTVPHEESILMEVIYTMKNPQDATWVYFNHAKPGADIASPTATAKRWKVWFKTVTTSGKFSEPKNIGGYKVSFIEITGTFQGPSAPGKIPARPNYTLYGAHLEDPEGNILVRMVGPTRFVEQSKKTLNEMLEKSLEAK